jgi:Protein of unknown function (DUF1501)
MAIDRRRLLKLTGAAALGTSLGAPFVSRAHAAGWADLAPLGVWESSYVPKKILEIHCVGGVSPWETFWVHEDQTGVADFHHQPTFTGTVGDMNWHCVGVPVPAGQTTAFGTDAAGRPIRWGPATKPLWRSDILSRSRLVVLAHDLLPHEAAAPLAITGNRLGRPRLAGTGAAIQHREVSLVIEQTGVPPLLPSSFVLAPANLGLDDYQATLATANGLHPGYAQPILIRVGTGTFENLLKRSGMTAQADQLISVYAGQFRDKLRFSGVGDPIRSAGFQSYETALKYLLNSPSLDNLLGGGVLSVSKGHICGTVAATEPPQNGNIARTQLQTAALLLANGVRHVAILDGGVDAERNYDTHTGNVHLDLTSAGIFRLCSELAAVVGTGPGQIDLDRTMIVINSEFGRGVDPDPSGGRDHWPYGYVSIIIGGPVRTTGIAGGLDSSGQPSAASGQPENFTPSDLRGAMLLAAGIDPFASENFAVQDFSGAVNDGSEQGTRSALRQRILGA